MSLNVYQVARLIDEQIPVGKACQVDGMLIYDLPGNPFTREPGLHRLMSNLIGSGFGAWRVVHHVQRGRFTFEHREPDPNKRAFYDWDRRPEGWSDAGWYVEDFSLPPPQD